MPDASLTATLGSATLASSANLATTILGPLQWPEELMVERSLRWRLVHGTIRAEPTIGGVVQVSSSKGGPIWMAEFNNVQLRGRLRQILRWQEFEALLKGGAIPVLVPHCLRQQGAITVTADGNHPARATVLHVDAAGDITAGQSFSLVHSTYGTRLYRIARVETPAGAPSKRIMQITPPLRQAVSNGAALNFATPACVMQLASEDSMALLLDGRKWGEPSVAFVEAF